MAQTGIYQIEFLDGSKYNLFFANPIQHKNTLQNIEANKEIIKSYSLILKGIHQAKQIEQILESKK